MSLKDTPFQLTNDAHAALRRPIAQNADVNLSVTEKRGAAANPGFHDGEEPGKRALMSVTIEEEWLATVSEVWRDEYDSRIPPWQSPVRLLHLGNGEASKTRKSTHRSRATHRNDAGGEHHMVRSSDHRKRSRGPAAITGKAGENRIEKQHVAKDKNEKG